MGINSLSDGLFLFSHFMNPRVMLLFGFTLSFPHRSFPCPVVRPCIINRDSKSSVFNSCVTSSRVSSLFISWSYLVDFLPCYFMAFCSDLASFPQSKQEGNHVEELCSRHRVLRLVLWVSQGQVLMASRQGGVTFREVRQALLQCAQLCSGLLSARPHVCPFAHLCALSLCEAFRCLGYRYNDIASCMLNIWCFCECPLCILISPFLSLSLCFPMFIFHFPMNHFYFLLSKYFSYCMYTF